MQRKIEKYAKNLERGEQAEREIKAALERLPGAKVVLQNVQVRGDNYKTAQVDAILFHETGIYVIESKNMSGWIFGDTQGQVWTQSFSRNKKYHFTNPILQNQAHIERLKESLNLPDQYFHSIICMGNDCTLKKIPEERGFIILKRYELYARLIGIIDNMQPLFNQENLVHMSKFLQT